MSGLPHWYARRGVVVSGLAAAAVVLLALAPAAARVALAQEAPDPGPPADAGGGGSGFPTPGAIGDAVGASVWRTFERFASQSGPAMLARFGLWLFGQLVNLLEHATGAGGVGSSPLLTSLPAYATYDAPLVQQAHGVIRGAALAGWGLVATAVLLWLLARMVLGFVVADELGLLPGLVASLVAVNAAGDVGRFLFQAANALSEGLRLGATALPAYGAITGYEQDVARAISALIYLPLVWFLFGARLFTLALADLLYVLGPLGVVLAVLPPTRPWFSWWAGLFVGACVVQVPQTLALTLGTGLVALSSRLANPHAAVELLTGAVMVLVAIKLPGMLPGGFGGRGGFVGLGIGRRVAHALGAFAAGPAGGAAPTAQRLYAALRPVGPGGGPLAPRPDAPGGPVVTRGPLLPAPVPMLPAPRD